MNVKTLLLRLRKLPFQKDEHQIVYTEGQYQPELNEFIKRNYTALKREFKARKYDFCYIPFLEQELLKPDITGYYAPFKGKTMDKVALGNDFILDFMMFPENKETIPPALLYYSPWNDTPYPGAEDTYRGLVPDFEEALSESKRKKRDRRLMDTFLYTLEVIDAYINTTHDSKIIGRPGNKDDDLPLAEQSFDSESKQLIREIQKRIEQLHQKGISDAILDRVLHQADKLSKLVITKDYQIELPDYGFDIKLPPLPKAVYFLFLRHKEGIVFKCLPDYRDELSEIYRKLRGGELSPKEQQSVNDVTDPLNNSINEKCARIREAFVRHFDERLACRYYIDGRKGQPKRISLPEHLIEWQA